MNSYGKYEKNKHIPFGKTYHFKNALAPTKNRSLKSIKVFSRSNVIKLEKKKCYVINLGKKYTSFK